MALAKAAVYVEYIRSGQTAYNRSRQQFAEV
jgi:hypothetical protein